MDVILSIGRQAAIPALASVLSVGNTPENLLALQYLGNADLMTKDVHARWTCLRASCTPART